MYKQFFHLSCNPFEMTPDPAFLFPTKKHNEALAALYYGVQRHKGFVVITGEVGTGKTLLIRCLLQLLKRSEITYSYIFNSLLSPAEFLQYIATELGIPINGRSKGELLLGLGNLLVERHQKKLTTVLVVDEAHHLSAQVLEEVRLLTNLETAQDKLLQILLVGQPELDEKLDSFELRQLKQRISLRAELQPLGVEDTAGYITRRLQQAGADSYAAKMFPVETVSAVYRHSRGIPRLINTICENALITAYARQSSIVTPSVVDDVASDLHLGRISHSAAPGNVAANGFSNAELMDAIRTLLNLSRPSDAPPETDSVSKVNHEPIV
jgi:general secretion pathway protein A